jgi:lipid A 3-O-deacylase
LKFFYLGACLLCLLLGPSAEAQAIPEKHANELQLWTAGGAITNGSQVGQALWSVGGRYGRVLTGSHGPGILHGNLEYAIDVIPVFVVLQQGGEVYGAGISPVALKWNFRPRRRIIPYVEAGSGAVFTNEPTPPGTSRTNFITSGAVGAHFLRPGHSWNIEVRYMHISNAGIARSNPGLNAIQLRVGVGHFTDARK